MSLSPPPLPPPSNVKKGTDAFDKISKDPKDHPARTMTEWEEYCDANDIKIYIHDRKILPPNPNPAAAYIVKPTLISPSESLSRTASSGKKRRSPSESEPTTTKRAKTSNQRYDVSQLSLISAQPPATSITLAAPTAIRPSQENHTRKASVSASSCADIPCINGELKKDTDHPPPQPVLAENLPAGKEMPFPTPPDSPQPRADIPLLPEGVIEVYRSPSSSVNDLVEGPCFGERVYDGDSSSHQVPSNILTEAACSPSADDTLGQSSQ